MEPNGGNFYLPHLLQINSGTFWRCAHGNTGMKGLFDEIGCNECARERITRLETALAQSEAGNAKLLNIIREVESLCNSEDARAFGEIAHLCADALSTTAGAETLAELQSLRDRLAKAEGERDAMRAQLHLPEDYCLSCGGTGGHEEGCRGTTGLIALAAELSTARESSEKLAGAVEEYLEAQDAFDNREYEANPGDHFALDKRRNAYRADLDAALAAHRKGEK